MIFRLWWRHTLLSDLCSCRAHLRQQLYWWWLSSCDVNSHMRWLPELALIRALFVLWSQAWQSHTSHSQLLTCKSRLILVPKCKKFWRKRNTDGPDWKLVCFSHFALPFLFSSETFSRRFKFLISIVLCCALFLIDTTRSKFDKLKNWDYWQIWIREHILRIYSAFVKDFVSWLVCYW